MVLPGDGNDFLFLQKFRNESMPACLEIFSLSVSHKARGLGIGALLCNHVEKLAKEQNVDLYLGKYDELSAELTPFVNMATVMLVTCYVGDMFSHFVSNIDVLETSTAQIPAIKLYKKLGYEFDRTWFEMNSLSLDLAYWGLGISCTACYKKLKGS